MLKFRVTIQGSKAGSIGAKYVDRHIFTVEVPEHAKLPDAINEAAIKRAHEDGLEHVLVVGYAGGK